MAVALFLAVAISQLPGTAATPAPDVSDLIAAGSYDAAEKAAADLAETTASLYGERSVSVLIVRNQLLNARLANGKAALRDTVALAESQLQLSRLLSGTLSHARGETLQLAGAILVEAGQFQRGHALLRDAIVAREQEAGPMSGQVAAALDAAARALIQAREPARALPLLQRSLRIRESLKQPPGRAGEDTIVLLATALQLAGDYAPARQYLNSSLTVQGPRQSAADIPFLNAAAVQLWFEGQLSEALTASREVVALAERTLRPEHPLLAEVLSNLAEAQASVGDLVAARGTAARVLDLTEQARGRDHYEVARNLNNVGNFDLLAGDYSRARDEFERALKIAQATVGPNHSWVATDVHNLALVNAMLGDYATARQLQLRASAIWARVFGPDHPFVAVALTELASVYRRQGHYADAIALLTRALAIRERRLGSVHTDVARTLADLALCRLRLGQRTRAQLNATRAMAIWEASADRNAPDHAVVLMLNGELQLAAGNTEAAERDFERALTIRRQAYGIEHPAVAEAQMALASALARRGAMTAAFTNALAAETIGREHLRLMLRSLPERESLNYAATRPRALDLMLSLTHDDASAARSVFDALIRTRALVLDEMAARRRDIGAEREELRQARQNLSARQQRLANLLVRGTDGSTVSQSRQLIDGARMDQERAERTLAEARLRGGLAAERVAGLDETLARLPAHSALVSFVHYRRSTVGSGLRTEEFYAAAIARKDLPTVRILNLGPAAVIDAAVRKWRAEAGGGSISNGLSRQSFERRYRDVATKLRQLVWDPLVAELGGAERVFLVPDASLHLVNFASLTQSDGRFLAESSPVLHYLSAERDLIQEPPATTAVGLLALGGPAFDVTARSAARATSRAAPQGCAAFSSIRFSPLPGTVREVKELSSLWNSTDTGAVEVLLGPAATETALKREARRRRVVHFATHGFFLSECTDAMPGTRSVGGLAPATPQSASMRSDLPLVRSGLALAGANQRRFATPIGDDGVLTAEEIAGLDLQGTEWAVLSACDTGLGEIRSGEGVLGLRRAFQIAGARTVIMSLWSVDDSATRQWMAALYSARLRDHLDTADSVSAANRSVLAQRRAAHLSTHPFYWAAFVAAGDYR